MMHLLTLCVSERSVPQACLSGRSLKTGLRANGTWQVG